MHKVVLYLILLVAFPIMANAQLTTAVSVSTKYNKETYMPISSYGLKGEYLDVESLEAYIIVTQPHNFIVSIFFEVSKQLPSGAYDIIDRGYLYDENSLYKTNHLVRNLYFKESGVYHVVVYRYNVPNANIRDDAEKQILSDRYHTINIKGAPQEKVLKLPGTEISYYTGGKVNFYLGDNSRPEIYSPTLKTKNGEVPIKLEVILLSGRELKLSALKVKVYKIVGDNYNDTSRTNLYSENSYTVPDKKWPGVRIPFKIEQAGRYKVICYTQDDQFIAQDLIKIK